MIYNNYNLFKKLKRVYKKISTISMSERQFYAYERIVQILKVTECKQHKKLSVEGREF